MFKKAIRWLPFLFTTDSLFLLKEVFDMSAVQLLPRYTYDDYVQWEGKWEVIRGIPYAMAPTPVPKHQYLANTIAVEFTVALKKCKNAKCINQLIIK